MIEPGTTQIQYTFNRSNSLQIQGGNEQHLYNQFLQACQPVFNSIDSLGRVANDHLNEPDVLNSLERQYGHFDTLMKQLQTDFIHAHPDLYSGAFVAVNYVSGLENRSIEHIQPLYDALQDKIKNSYFGRKLKSVLDVLRQTAVGQPAPDFTTPDISNKPVALSSLKGHIVLLDFWASWCGPCRRANPELVSLYKKYKGPGFEILGVSLDDNMNSWKAAVKADGITWPQVSELKKWDSKCVSDYHIEAIPFSVLIDAKGKILAKGLTPEDLASKISEVLKKNS